MIFINLIPEHLRKKSAKDALFFLGIDIPREVSLGVGGIFVSFLVLCHAGLFSAQAAEAAHLGMLKIQWEKLLPDRGRIDAIGVEVKDLKKKLTVVMDIISSKTGNWSKRLNVLSDALPKGVWFRKIDWDGASLRVDGEVFSKTGGEIVTIGNFVAYLKKDPAFTDGFNSIEVQSIQRNKRGDTEVADFAVVAKVTVPPKDAAKK